MESTSFSPTLAPHREFGPRLLSGLGTSPERSSTQDLWRVDDDVEPELPYVVDVLTGAAYGSESVSTAVTVHADVLSKQVSAAAVDVDVAYATAVGSKQVSGIADGGACVVVAEIHRSAEAIVLEASETSLAPTSSDSDSTLEGGQVTYPGQVTGAAPVVAHSDFVCEGTRLYTPVVEEVSPPGHDSSVLTAGPEPASIDLAVSVVDGAATHGAVVFAGPAPAVDIHGAVPVVGSIHASSAMGIHVEVPVAASHASVYASSAGPVPGVVVSGQYIVGVHQAAVAGTASPSPPSTWAQSQLVSSYLTQPALAQVEFPNPTHKYICDRLNR